MCRWICVCLCLLQLCMPALSRSINHRYRWQVFVRVPCTRTPGPVRATHCGNCRVQCSTGGRVVTASLLGAAQFPRFPWTRHCCRQWRRTHARAHPPAPSLAASDLAPVMSARLINSSDCLLCLHKVGRRVVLHVGPFVAVPARKYGTRRAAAMRWQQQQQHF